MRITWVTRSFLDYRIPVYKALDELCGHRLTVIYNGEVVPKRCQDKIKTVLGDRAVAMSGEIRLSGVAQDNATMANKGIRIPIQKGLIKAIRNTNPDVLVSDGFFQWTYAPLIVRALGGKRIKHVMCYERTPHTERNAGKLRTVYRRFAGRFIDGIDCNGTLTQKYLTESLDYCKPLAFGHMTAEISGVAIRCAKVKPEEVATLRQRFGFGQLTFLYLGQLIPRKGILELLKAWVAADLKDASLLLVGDGKQKEEILEFINLHHLTNVTVVGAVDYDSLGPYYRVADCFIIPTLEDNWSLVVPEAMASGLPIACSIYNGCHPELVKPENGWTFDPLEQQNTVEVLRTISDNRDKLPEMGDASKRIVANHTPEHAAKNLYGLCKTLIDEK